MNGMLLRVIAPHFVAAAELSPRGTVIRTAPILKYVCDWPAERAVSYFTRKGWQVEAIFPPTQETHHDCIR